MTRLADGDRSAFEAVFSAALPPVRALARRMLGHDADAEDAAQEALMKVFRHASDYDPSRDALPWILGITAWSCRTARKKRGRRREVADAVLDDLEAPVEGPEQALLSRELSGALDELLGGLSAADQETIAATLDRERRGALRVGAATFRKRLERALARLRQSWRMRHG